MIWIIVAFVVGTILGLDYGIRWGGANMYKRVMQAMLNELEKEIGKMNVAVDKAKTND